MIASVRQIGILMIAVAFLSLGHGLHGSLIGVRASAENFATVMTGFIMSAYFAGLLLSAWLTPRIVQTVGHIRVFAGFASVVSTAVMLFPCGSIPSGGSCCGSWRAFAHPAFISSAKAG